jgi:hypothetical protein
VNEFETALYDPDYKDPENGYRKYIDENTFIDWILINELAKNNDAIMYASVFLSKDRDGKLKMGPLWDFDSAFGNINYNDNPQYEDGLWVATATWISRLFQDEDFAQKARNRYDELKPVFDRLPELIAQNARQLIDAGAIDRNFERWDILGQYVWPNDAPYPSTYEGEVRRLTDWTKARNSWMNVNFKLSDADRCAKLAGEKIPLRPFDTDKFEAGEPTTIRAVRGYAKYLWNDEIETDTYELNISKGGNYWVKVFDETGCSNAVSDTLSMKDTGTGTGNLGKAADLSAYATQGIIYLSDGVQSASLIGVGGTTVIPERKIDGHTLNVDRLPKGAYILKMVGGDNRIVVRKIIL